MSIYILVYLLYSLLTYLVTFIFKIFSNLITAHVSRKTGNNNVTHMWTDWDNIVYLPNNIGVIHIVEYVEVVGGIIVNNHITNYIFNKIQKVCKIFFNFKFFFIPSDRQLVKHWNKIFVDRDLRIIWVTVNLQSSLYSLFPLFHVISLSTIAICQLKKDISSSSFYSHQELWEGC